MAVTQQRTAREPVIRLRRNTRLNIVFIFVFVDYLEIGVGLNHSGKTRERKNGYVVRNLNFYGKQLGNRVLVMGGGVALPAPTPL